jgi:DNA-binding transcriptional LysR family regulator
MNGGVSPIIAKFLAANPLVRVYVDMTNRRVDVVEEGFDLAIRVRSLPLEPTNLAMRKLGESEGVVVGHPALLTRLGRPAHPNDITRYPTLSMTMAGDRYSWQFREKDGSTISVNHVPRLMTDSFDALRAACAAGVGLGYLPQFVVHRDIQRGELEQVLPEFGLGAGLAHVVFPSRRGMVPAVRALLDALVEGFTEAGPMTW